MNGHWQEKGEEWKREEIKKNNTQNISTKQFHYATFWFYALHINNWMRMKMRYTFYLSQVSFVSKLVNNFIIFAVYNFTKSLTKTITPGDVIENETRFL